MRRRFVSDIEVTPELLKGADHTRCDLWASFGAPWDAVVGSVQIEKLMVPTEPSRPQLREAILVRVFGSAEQRETEYDDEEDT